MLRFAVDENGDATREISLAGAYLIGSDGVPLRAEIEYKDSVLTCQKRAEGPAGLAILWPVPGCGNLMLETSRLVERERTYNLPLELVRGRLMRMSQKREDWGLFDFDGFQPVAAEIDKARDLFVEAVKMEDFSEQFRTAEKALQLAIIAGEKLSQFHADIFLTRRKQNHAFSRRTIGCTLDPRNTSEVYRQLLKDGFDYAHLPISWRLLEPKQQEYNWRLFDTWIEWLTRNRIPIHAGPLVNFQESQLPDWLAMYETDFETVRNLIFDHVRRVVERYGNYVFHWDVISGVHSDNTFNFTFEQLMEITRVSTAMVKQLAPRADAVINITAPWGEYYARNQRTIPPMLYADMVVQSGVSFDGLGAQILFGAAADGMYVRDMFQVSEKLDRLGNFGKPVHLTAVQVPSSSPTDRPISSIGGSWRKPWDESVQAHWIKEFTSIALSKPFVESVTWSELVDQPENSLIPSGGLLYPDLTPKLGYKTLAAIRTQLHAATRRPPATR
ncbi:MAG TPA: endo-1,4-beta-xylanase [Phycisphaerae bacterium]|nr:endo-1,4-beta-xylanase [Phycisphaerae bacterium]HON66153.1 endo-1,4-beta-xylanase [Phycisphaerae bacterium]HPP25661.1 endo-1,4-beta-xylanase [Phycisphaerae bacterium]